MIRFNKSKNKKSKNLQKTIVYVEPYALIRDCAHELLEDKFPNYRIQTAIGYDDDNSELIQESGGISNIALLFTTDKLIRQTGWELVEQLRKEGYTGPAVYLGIEPLPEEYSKLFQETRLKWSFLFNPLTNSNLGEDIIKIAEKYLK